MEKIKNNKILPYIIILIVALLLSVPLMQQGINTGHDGEFHISRTVGTIEQIQNNESPLVVSRFSQGLGFGWNLFYPPITTAINVLFAVITQNVVIAMKLFAFVTLLISGIAMYKLVLTITKNKLCAIFSAILYMIAPYRMMNIYVRLAVGEMASFMFMPIILRGLYCIFNNETNKSYLLILGAIALALTHNISIMLMAIICLVYVLVNIRKLSDKKILKTLIFSVIVIALTVLFFELPLFEQLKTTDYEVERKMFTRQRVQNGGLNPISLVTSAFETNGMYFTIGIPTIIGLFLIPFAMKTIKKDKTLKQNYKFYMITGFVSCLMATIVFPWYIMPKILLNIQFPWRMLEIIDLCFAIVCGINFELLYETLMFKNKSNKTTTNIIVAVATLLVTASCLYSLSFTKNLQVRNIGNDYFKEEEIIDTKWEVSRYSSYLEYWPQQAEKSMDYILNVQNKIHILQGNAKIENENKTNGTLNFKISDVEPNTIIELPYIFYKGYEVKYTSTNGETKILSNQESNHGLTQIQLEEGIDGTINVTYQPTKLYKICLVISLTTFTAYLIYLIVLAINRNRKK